MDPGLHNVGGVKCQPFLQKHSNHWKRALKMAFKGSRCFQFPEAVVTSTAKESLYALPNVVHYKFSLFYLIVKNWFISVFINVFLYRLAFSSKAISCRYPQL